MTINILVTGSNGLVGKAFQDLYKNNDNFNYYYVQRSLDGDFSIYNNVDKLFKTFQPNVVIHLAAQVGGLYKNINHNYDMLIDNIKINTNIIEACKKYKINRFINVLSTCIFSNECIYPLTSDQILKGEPDESNKGYSYSKRISYIASELLSNTYDIDVINLIPTNLYGYNDNYNIENAHVIPALIHKFYLRQNKLIYPNLIIKGTGKAKRQYVHADDFAKIIYEFITLNLNKKFNSLIIGPPESDEITIKELVEKIEYIYSTRTDIMQWYYNKIIYDESYSDGQLIKTVNNNELLTYLPNFKFTNITDGLNKTIDYFITNYETIRK